MVSADYEAQALYDIMCEKNVLNVTRELCDGKISCPIEVSNRVFGYPCEESYQYNLTVKYTCGKFQRLGREGDMTKSHGKVPAPLGGEVKEGTTFLCFGYSVFNLKTAYWRSVLNMVKGKKVNDTLFVK